MCIKIIEKYTAKILDEWKDVYGFAPDSVANKLSEARLDWLIDLTYCLEIWINKSDNLTDGELLLARANIGAIVEGWLKFFYCVYYEDYKNKPIKYKKKMTEPNDLSFQNLKKFSRGKLWEENDEWDKWVDSIQYRRNAIHAYNNRDIGDTIIFLDDVEKLKDFIELINTSLPDISQRYDW